MISAISVLQNKYSNHLENLETTHLRKIEIYKNTLNDFIIKLEKEHHKIISISQNTIKSSEQSIKKLQNEYSNQLIKIGRLQENSINDYKKNLQSFIAKLSTEQDNIISTSTDIINNAKNEFRQFISYQKEEINKHHISLISSTKKIVTNTVEQLDKSTLEHNKIFNNQDKTIKQHLDIYKSFLDKVNELIQYINKVDFPSRLDKIDNTISSINIGIQNLQGIVNDLLREQQKKFEYFEKLMTENFTKINSQNKKTEKKHQLYFFIVIALIIISSIIIKFA